MQRRSGSSTNLIMSYGGRNHRRRIEWSGLYDLSGLRKGLVAISEALWNRVFEDTQKDCSLDLIDYKVLMYWFECV